MTLTNPSIDYKTLRDDILALFRANYATLNTGLTSTFGSTTLTTQIIGGDPFLTPQPVTLYPTIMVKLIGKDEQFENIGNAGRKRPVVNFAIYAITAKIEEDIDAEIALLAKNMEGILRDNITFGTVCIYSDLGRGEFGAGNSNDVYVNIYRVQLACMLELK